MSQERSLTIDYSSVTSELAKRVSTSAPLSFEQGRKRMEAAVMRLLECTPARARHVVSSLVKRGYARFGAHPYFTSPNVGQWTYHPPAA
ncbi:MAG TPA: hypothetical protein ENK57_19295 [Polyangiaceae bacterium]|nr:hypothetical protein [Polyangiaceae bacterium]